MPWAGAVRSQVLRCSGAAEGVNLAGTELSVSTCSYGPIEFDVANSTYMAGLGSWAMDRSMATFRTFRPASGAGYSRLPDRSLDDALIDSLIEMRVVSLRRWAAKPSTAPIGIRNAPAAWIETLERFVRQWFSEDGETHR
jgi:hypothetical protein